MKPEFTSLALMKEGEAGVLRSVLCWCTRIISAFSRESSSGCWATNARIHCICGKSACGERPGGLSFNIGRWQQDNINTIPKKHYTLISVSWINTSTLILRFFLSAHSPCAAEKSISGCGRERADIHRSLSLLGESNATIRTRNNILGRRRALRFLQCVSAKQKGFRWHVQPEQILL